MTIYFHISFLMFFILITSINSSRLAQTNNNTTITDEIIQGICSQTSNPSLCLNNLKPLEGKSRLPNSVAAIGREPMNMALSQADEAAAVIWRRYTGTKTYKRQTQLRYHKCFMIYSVEVIDQLKKASNYLLAGNAKSVKKCVSAAVNRVNSCDKELMKPPREQSAGSILEADRMFKDLCSIVLAICNKVPK